MATTADVLAKKGNRVVCVSPTATVLEATQLMSRNQIGAVVVTVEETWDRGKGCHRVVGMFTERDVLTRVVGEQRTPTTTLVEEVMSNNVAFVTPETKLDDVGAVMRKRRIRHLPVCGEGGELKGLISIGDLNAWHSDGLATEIHYLNEYIHGRV